MAAEHVNSVLVGDMGSVHTRLVLIDLVEGQYRLIASSRARTTAAPPLGSASIGLEFAARHMSELIGRTLISEDSESLFYMPESSGHGVDAFLATSSAGRPMRAFLVGVTPEISMVSGRRVLGGSYISIVDTLCPDDQRSEEEKINTLLTNQPDLILIVGGTDDGADDILIEQVALVKTALSLIRYGTMPSVLYAGNRALQRRVRELLEPHTEVFVAQNVRPTLRDERLFPAQIELAFAYDAYRSKPASGFQTVGTQSSVGVVPTAQGIISALRYMGELQEQGIGPLFVDVGSANSAIVSTVNKQVQFGIRTDLGVGHNLVSAFEAITLERLRDWLPFDISDDELWDYAQNKQLRPATVPATTEELMIEQAAAREILRLLQDDVRPAWETASDLLPDFQPIIAAGAVLTEAQHPGISALLLLDALQPVGQVDLRLDPHNLVSALGVIAYLKPVITVQAFESGGLVNLGTAFCPLGRVRPSQDAMQIRIRLENGQTFERTVKGGDMWLASMLPGLKAQVTVKLGRGLTINGKRRIKTVVTAGTAGIIFDARGRPFVQPRPRDRAARFMEWQFAMTGRERRPALPVAATGAAAPDQPGEAVPLPSMDDLTAEPLDTMFDLDELEF
ncbi:MAG: glutamate mutase L [Anaerolineae bacterium]|nr:glutamate mutase L [Anaerolineae bacterium]